MELTELISRCKKHDLLAQEQLYRKFSVQLFGVCLKYSRSYSEAQDHLQDGFILILEKIKQFDFKGSFEGWAKRVVINHILKSYRNTIIFEQVSDFIVEEDQEMEVISNDLSMEFLLALIQQLPDQYRLVFNLYAIDNYAHKEISEALGISINTSKSNLSRARNILKRKIETETNLVSK